MGIFKNHMAVLLQVPANSHVLQGPYLQPGPSIPQSPYSVSVVPLHESGLCELILVILVLLLWLYSFYRLYSVWQKTLNFSEASIQGPQGWDLLVNWVMERIQVRQFIKCIVHLEKCTIRLALIIREKSPPTKAFFKKSALCCNCVWIFEFDDFLISICFTFFFFLLHLLLLVLLPNITLKIML